MVSDEPLRRRLGDAAGGPTVRKSVKWELPLWMFACTLLAVTLFVGGHPLVGLLAAILGGLATLAFLSLRR